MTELRPDWVIYGMTTDDGEAIVCASADLSTIEVDTGSHLLHPPPLRTRIRRDRPHWTSWRVDHHTDLAIATGGTAMAAGPTPLDALHTLLDTWTPGPDLLTGTHYIAEPPWAPPDTTWEDTATQCPEFVQWIVRHHGTLPKGPITPDDWDEYRHTYEEAHH